jgi:hypothetical protein
MQAHKRARIEITGRPPGLVMNNGELADDTNPFAIQIAEIRPPRGKKLTDEQRERKDHLNWEGSLYTNAEGRLILPARHLFKAVVEAAREVKMGTAIEDRGAVSLEQTELPVNLGKDEPEPYDTDKLWADSRYRFRTLVNPNPSSRNSGKLPLMRPVFPVWSAEVTMRLLPEMINWDVFEKIIEGSGNVGVGNARKLSYGRFDVVITDITEEP